MNLYIWIEDILYNMNRNKTSSILYCCKLVISFLICVEHQVPIFHRGELTYV